MDNRVINSYKKYIDNFVYSDEGLTLAELKQVLSKRFDINVNNPIILSKIKTIPLMYPSIEKELKQFVSNIINQFKKEYEITNKRYSVTQREYWIVRGFTNKEIDGFIFSLQKNKEKEHIKAKYSAIKNSYSKIGVDIENISIKDAITKAIRFYFPIKQNSDVENNIIQYIMNEYPDIYPSIIKLKECVYKITNPSNKVGGSCISTQYWISFGYSQEEAKEIVSAKQKERSKCSAVYWKNLGYSEEEAKKLVSSHQRHNSKGCKEYWMDRGYKEKDIPNLISEYHNKQKSLFPWCIEYWMCLGYSYSDAVIRKDEYIKELKKTNPTQKEYWLNLGYSYESRVEEIKKLNPFNKEYWINLGYTETDANIFIKELHPRNIEYWIKNTNTKKEAISLHEEYLKTIMLSHESVSNISIECFDMINKHFPCNKVYYGRENEYSLYSKTHNLIRFYDYVDKSINVVIEFNGEYFHRTEEQILNDKIKKELAESYGFKVLYIWESQFRNDKEGVVSNIVNLLKEEI